MMTFEGFKDDQQTDRGQGVFFSTRYLEWPRPRTGLKPAQNLTKKVLTVMGSGQVRGRAREKPANQY